MRNNFFTITIIIAMAMLMAACGTAKKAANVPSNNTNITTTTTDDPFGGILASLGDWRTMKSGGNINLRGSSNLSSSIQVRMVRDQDIFISLRPMLGIEVGRMLITADSLYAVDKIHKRYVAEKVSLLTAGIPVTVSDVQDIFLGRPFIIGKGTLNTDFIDVVTVNSEDGKVELSPTEQYKGYGYTFKFDQKGQILSLDIVPQGSTTAAYQVQYNDVRNTQVGNIAHGINVNATIEKKKLDFSLTYKNIDWNGNVKIERGIPEGYTRMSAKDLFGLFN